MIRTAVMAANVFCMLFGFCHSNAREMPMPDSRSMTALYRISDKKADGPCIRATLTPVRSGNGRVQAVFCNAEDIAYLKDESPRHWMATVLGDKDPAPRLLPVTVGLDVSIIATSPAGETSILAMPRPSPLHLPARLADLRTEIEYAIRNRQPIAFALSDSRTIIDAAPIDLDTALAMLGMRP